MKERPIPFIGPMVRAILDGRQTQTRRVVKLPLKDPLTGGEVAGCEANSLLRQGNRLCPYGQPGDRLWVRETFKLNATLDGIRTTYRADDSEAYLYPPESWDGIPDDNHWRQPIIMPRWASRIILEITAVRVERLNDISDTDAIREGIPDYPDFTGDSPVDDYSALWDSINGPGSWSANPWVWVIEFRVLEGGKA